MKSTNYLFYDIDGTLVGKSQHITAKNKRALLEARLNGHKVFLCTGRAYFDALRGLDGLEVDGMITCAGGIVSVGEDIVYEHPINGDFLGRVLGLFQEHDVLYTLESKDGNFHIPAMQDFYLDWIEQHFKDDEQARKILRANHEGALHYPMDAFDEKHDPVYKICFLSKKKENFENIREELSKYFYIHYFSDFFDNHDGIDGELIPKDCTKAHGVKKILEYYRGEIKDTAAFGDSANDLQMISCVNTGVVRADGPEELKTHAAAFFEDPDQDGIYYVMKQLKLI